MYLHYLFCFFPLFFSNVHHYKAIPIDKNIHAIYCTKMLMIFNLYVVYFRVALCLSMLLNVAIVLRHNFYWKMIAMWILHLKKPLTRLYIWWAHIRKNHATMTHSMTWFKWLKHLSRKAPIQICKIDVDSELEFCIF